MRNQHRRAGIGLARWWGSAALCVPIAAAWAGSFSVNPVRVTLSGARPIASLSVRNAGTDTAVVQVEASGWSQQDGQGVLTPTRDILATPPIVTIPPGGSQSVRVGLRRPQDAKQELPYRLVFREVPAGDAAGAGLRIMLAISIPVFVPPPGTAAPVVTWVASRAADGIRVAAANSGNAHVQVTQFELVDAGTGRKLAHNQTPAYLLPGDRREWLLKLDPPGTVPGLGGPVRLAAKTDGGDLHAELILGNGGAASASPQADFPAATNPSAPPGPINPSAQVVAPR